PDDLAEEFRWLPTWTNSLMAVTENRKGMREPARIRHCVLHRVLVSGRNTQGRGDPTGPVQAGPASQTGPILLVQAWKTPTIMRNNSEYFGILPTKPYPASDVFSASAENKRRSTP